MTRMKDSGIEWIGQIPEEWGVIKFKYFFDTNKGLTITKENLSDEGIPVINYGQIHSQFGKSVRADDSRLPFVPQYYLKFRQSLLNKGDFVFADTSEDIAGSGNFSTRMDDVDSFFAGYHTIKATLKNKSEHDFRYFMHLFDSLAFRKQIQNRVSGIKVFSITQSILQETLLLLPSLNEQTKIADFLDKKVAQLDQAKSSLEEQIQKLEDYRQSLIYETVTKGLDKNAPMKDSGVDWIGQVPEGWEIGRVKDICSMKSGDNLISIQISEIQEELFYPVYGGNGQRGYFNQYTNDGEFCLIGRQGALAGNIHYVTGKFWATDHAVVVYEKNGFIVKYLYYLFSVMNLNRYAFETGAQPGLSVEKILNLKTIICPKNVQMDITAFLDAKVGKINQLIAIKQKQIANINQQRQTLIYDYVTGKRRV